jgi:hypothetical protein
MALQIYLYKRDELTVDQAVIDTFSILKERVFNVKDLQSLPSYLAALDVFQIAPTEEETAFLMNQVKLAFNDGIDLKLSSREVLTLRYFLSQYSTRYKNEASL